MTTLTPKDIVKELDRFIVGQNDAKRAVAVALRNRWRRLQLPRDIRDEVLPKNILMIGPTGVGKTEIARRLAKLADAPFIKVEATKFTEIGYVGRDVEQIVRDLVEISIKMTKKQLRANVESAAKEAALERILDALVGHTASPETRLKFRHRIENGDLLDKEIEIELSDNSSLSMPTMDVPGMPGAQMGMISLGDIFGKSFGGGKTKTRKMTIDHALKTAEAEEADKLLDNDDILAKAIEAVEQNGIVFLDEIDKICARTENRGGDVSREGVQRDLLPLIEGTTVNTKHGPVKTDHILFITSGAFHVAKPADLLPELQGRLPIRVELQPLLKEDFLRILKEPEFNLIRQATALLSTENLEITFTEDALDALAEIATSINSTIENIGARRLHTLLEKVLEDISFHASDSDDKTLTLDGNFIRDRLQAFSKQQDLSKFIL